MTSEKTYSLDPRKWVENYADYLFNYTVTRVSDPEVAADLVQETFLSALKAQERFQGKSTEKTWLTSILKRKIIDVYRKRGSARETTMQDFGEQINDDDFFRSVGAFAGHWKDGEGPNSNSLLPEGEFENSELGEIIQKCISLLPENLSAVFVMKMIDEATSEEICKELDITASNVWVMMHRARLKLRKCIESNWR